MIGTRTFFLACLLLALFAAGLLLGGVFSSPQEMPTEAREGQAVWRNTGCEGCHTLYGHGGPYGPDLTGIYAQRGETYIREFMVNPNAFHPGARLMPRFNLTVDQTTQVIAFLRYIGEQGDWPPRPLQVAGGGGLLAMPGAAAPAPDEDPALTRGRLVYSQRCASCHSLERDVVIVGPTLWGIADLGWHRVPGLSAEQYIRESILYPDAYIVEGFADVMQKNLAEQLSSSDMDDLIAFLLTLRADN